MKIIKGDNVKMLIGKDRGKTGKVVMVLPNTPASLSRLVIEGLNLVKKHQRAKKQGQKGQIVSKERAVNIASVQLVCPSCQRAARVGYRWEGEKKVRFCKKCSSTVAAK